MDGYYVYEHIVMPLLKKRKENERNVLMYCY